MEDFSKEPMLNSMEGSQNLPPSTLANTSTPNKPVRLRFIDMTRGFVMFFLAVTSFFPPDEWKTNPIVFWFSQHPDYYANQLTLYDLGTPACVFIISIIMGMVFTHNITV
jgi:hypothetical protein